MRTLLAVFMILLGASSGFAQTPIGTPNTMRCNKIATFTGVAAATQLVAPAARKTVLFCGWHITSNSATAANAVVNFGTQTTNPCDTNTVAASGVLNVTQSAPSTDHTESATNSGAVGSGLCVTPSATSLSGMVWYTIVDTPQ